MYEAIMVALSRVARLALSLSLALGPLACSGGESPEPGAGAGGRGSLSTGSGDGVGGDSLAGIGGNLTAGTGGESGSGAGASSGLLPARVWRLSHEQYRKSVVDLVGIEPDLSNFSPESGNGKFTNFSSTAFVQVDLAANYYKVAQTIATDLSTSQLAALTNCPLMTGCRDEFIAELGAKAFRAPVPVEVKTRLTALFDLASAEVGTESAFRAVLTAILNSPLFLHRKEIGPESEPASPELNLTDHQLAEFLSFSLLGSPPPAWLRDAADAGSLSAGDLTPTLERLMAEPAFSTELGQFLTEWLEVSFFDQVEKSDVFPGFETARPLMLQELREFLAQSGSSERGLKNLLLDPVPPVSPALENFYGSDPSAPQSAERIGILGLGSVLASHAKSYLTSPTLRGKFVRARFLCREITLPEGFTPPPLSETEALGVAKSTRELYEQHQLQAVCATCHELTDPIGFALEAFDGAGRVRTLDTTQGFSVPVDTTATLVESDVDRPLLGAKDLSVALSESNTVKECLARQAFRFYFGQEELTKQEPAVMTAFERLRTEDKLGALAAALFSTKTTTLRTRGGSE